MTDDRDGSTAHVVSFLLCFVASAAAVAFFAKGQQHLEAVIAGVVALLAHWWLTSSGADDEHADASYFLGYGDTAKPVCISA